MLNKTFENNYPRHLYIGDTLPPPNEYEDGDLFFLYPAAELYGHVGGTWVLLATSAALVGATNIGGAPGEVFESIVAGVLQFRTLDNTDGYIVISTNPTTVQFDLNPSFVNAVNNAVQNAVNIGTGFEVFESKVGNTLRFRTLSNQGTGANIIIGQTADEVQFRSLVSSDGSVVITENPLEIDLVVDPSVLGLVSGAANVGTGTGEVFRNLVAGILYFRRLLDGGGAVDIATVGDDVVITGAEGQNLGAAGARVFESRVGNNLRFRRLVAGANVTITENPNDITIAAAGAVNGTHTAYALGSSVYTTPSLNAGGAHQFVQPSFAIADFAYAASANGVVIVSYRLEIIIRALDAPAVTFDMQTLSNAFVITADGGFTFGQLSNNFHDRVYLRGSNTSETRGVLHLETLNRNSGGNTYYIGTSLVRGLLTNITATSPTLNPRITNELRNNGPSATRFEITYALYAEVTEAQ